MLNPLQSLYFVRSYIASGDVKLYFLEGKYNCAGIMTKAFGNKSSATQHWRYTMRKGALSVLRASQEH